ncbi:MAG TPA: deoxyribose-phosphate aldolase [Bacteroidales bacterium]
MSSFETILSKFPCEESDSLVKANVEKILNTKLKENETMEVYKTLFSCIDLTSLNSGDNDESIQKLVQQVNIFGEEHPGFPNVAGICVYPCFAEIVRDSLEEDNVRNVVVAGGFPTSQTFTAVKVAEVALAIADGAEEVDIVMQQGLFRADDYDSLIEEISEIKHTCRGKLLKVILETSMLQDASEIAKASLLAIFAGADFIKTSTGKADRGATPEAVYVMCKVIKKYNQQFNTKIGLKVSGGVSTSEQAVMYYTIVKEVLGEEWLNKDLFRIGTSRLVDTLIKKFEE